MSPLLKLVSLLCLVVVIGDGLTGYGDPWANHRDIADGIYTITKLAVSITGIVAIVENYAIFRYSAVGKTSLYNLFYGFIAILFQPVISVEFEPATWYTIYLLTALAISLDMVVTTWIGRKIMRRYEN